MNGKTYRTLLASTIGSLAVVGAGLFVSLPAGAQQPSNQPGATTGGDAERQVESSQTGGTNRQQTPRNGSGTSGTMNQGTQTSPGTLQQGSQSGDSGLQQTPGSGSGGEVNQPGATTGGDAREQVESGQTGTQQRGQTGTYQQGGQTGTQQRGTTTIQRRSTTQQQTQPTQNNTGADTTTGGSTSAGESEGQDVRALW